jgi:F-box and leucine-rich repeat protein GRR1
MASPNQSSTSLSDDDEDYNGITPVEHRTPARWSLSRQPTSATHAPYPPPLSPAALLPTEILIHALRQLTTPKDLYACLLVSKLWCECSVELLWHKPVVTKLPALFKMITVIGKEEETTFAYSTFIRRLNFVAIASEMSDLLFNRLAACTRLERLTLVGCAALSDEAIGKVLPSCPNLVALDLTNVVDVSDAALLLLAGSASRLQGINLGGCKKVTDRGIIALARSCHLLRRIKLHGLVEITDESVSVLASECPLLLEVDLNCCHKVSAKSVQDLWMLSKHMREWRLSQCLDLRDEAFPVSPSVPDSALMGFQLTQSLPPLRLPNLFDHLRMLDLTALPITDAAVDGIISVAPKIRNLVLAKCSEITDKSVESICHLGKHLHYLHLGHATA